MVCCDAENVAFSPAQIETVQQACAASRSTSQLPITYPEIEALATHPALLAVMTELQEGAPNLVQCSILHEDPVSGNVAQQCQRSR